ncbi:molybdopterin molybdenumtransferase MoeA [Rhodoferax sp. TH121]|uniref:molybdopterin molybdotransferase MoeA n=1 Tax=Rhodoferax sp. TH121 TaxID=2022803 RepID=UPI000B96B59A|nr:gephyrin-like molybdotransferase Glp [Rhodoferax sp. TH121]OYQ40203.1 molybdopterin molybdenumtransferase MoeA [Rhodoferax sp. TH121]
MSTAPRKPLMPLDDALAQLLASVAPLTQTEALATGDADGRVLAQAIVSGLQVPPCDNSAMDGYAVRVDDVLAAQGALPVSQRIAAGSVGTPLQPGTVARIFTGAPVPPGADAVVMQEECVVVDAADAASAHVQIHSTPLPGQNIRRSGEDVARGDVVLAAGARLGPAALGLGASVGMAQLQVVRKPRVALFSTGDELVLPGTVPPEQMPPGAIYNSNRFFLSAMLRRLGCEVTDLGIVPDRLDATVEALQQAAASHDLVLTSGGVSVGEEDHIKPAVQSLGQLDLWQIAIKPGKPFAHGRIGAAHFIGLPGNPVSSFVTFVLLVRPFLLRMQGVQDVAMKSIAARADFDWPRAEKRREFLRVRRNEQGGLELFTNQSSGVLTSAVWGDGLIDTPPGEPIHYGATVRYIPFSELLA